MPKRWDIWAAVATLVVATVVLTGVPISWQLTHRFTSVGARPTQLQEPITSSAATTGEPTKAPITPAPSGTIPLRVLAPSIGLNAAVVPITTDATGQAEVPPDGIHVGWYQPGTMPGAATGSAVLVGHRDTWSIGPAVLYRLGSLSIGDRITLIGAHARTLTYRVVARQYITKSKLPVAQLFSATGPPLLTLISCGGSWSPSSGYSDNVVVTAVPA